MDRAVQFGQFSGMAAKGGFPKNTLPEFIVLTTKGVTGMHQ